MIDLLAADGRGHSFKMRIRAVYPAKNFILYVTYKENKVLKFDMSDIIENDSDFLELKNHPEIFADVRLVNKKRSIGWRDNITLSGDIVEKNGTPVNLGYLEVYSNEFEELQRHYTEPIVKKALNNRYGSFIYFEEGEFKEFAEWLYGCYISNLDKDDNSADIAFLYKNMQDRMTWVRESEKNWIEFISPGAGDNMFSKDPYVEYLLRNDRFGDPQKMNEGDTIWWLDDIEKRGPRLFTFDLKEVFNFWSDYPDSLTPEQKAIFDKECPELAKLKYNG